MAKVPSEDSRISTIKARGWRTGLSDTDAASAAKSRRPCSLRSNGDSVSSGQPAGQTTVDDAGLWALMEAAGLGGHQEQTSQASRTESPPQPTNSSRRDPCASGDSSTAGRSGSPETDGAMTSRKRRRDSVGDESGGDADEEDNVDKLVRPRPYWRNCWWDRG